MATFSQSPGFQFLIENVLIRRVLVKNALVKSALVKSALMLSILVLFFSSQSVNAEQTFSNYLCQIQFAHPNGWRVETLRVAQAYSGSERHECAFNLVPPASEFETSVFNESEYTLSMRSGFAAFNDVAGELGFEFVSSQWVLDSEIAEPIRSNTLQGIIGKSHRVCDAKVPLDSDCTEYRIVLTSAYEDSGRMVVLTGGDQSRSVRQLLLRSLETENIEAY